MTERDLSWWTPRPGERVRCIPSPSARQYFKDYVATHDLIVNVPKLTGGSLHDVVPLYGQVWPEGFSAHGTREPLCVSQLVPMDWVTEKSPYVEVGEKIRVLSREKSNSTDAAGIPADLVGKVFEVRGTNDDPRNGMFSNRQDGLPVMIDEGRWYVGHYERVADHPEPSTVETPAKQAPTAEVDTVTMLIDMGVPRTWADYHIRRHSRGARTDHPSWASANTPAVKLGATVDFNKDGVTIRGTVIATEPDDYRAATTPLPALVWWSDEGKSSIYWPASYKVVDAGPLGRPSDAQDKEPETDEDWAARITAVLDTIQKFAYDEEWCEEYEASMERLFDIDPGREPVAADWTVEVTLCCEIDLEQYVMETSAFGYCEDILSEDTPVDSQATEVRTTVTFTMSHAGEPSEDDIKEYLDEKDDLYFSSLIVRTVKRG